jgi:hypothetical protein
MNRFCKYPAVKDIMVSLDDVWWCSYVTYLSEIDWNSVEGRLSVCGSSTVGKGLLGSMLVGNAASMTGGGAVAAGVEVCLCSGDFDGALFLLAGSALVLRAGSFLFLSIAVAYRPAAM